MIHPVNIPICSGRMQGKQGQCKLISYLFIFEIIMETKSMPSLKFSCIQQTYIQAEPTISKSIASSYLQFLKKNCTGG